MCAGVTIGDHSVIGAGSIVTRDIPSCVLAGGNPARVIRELTPPDEATLYELNP
nr:acetyltransferase [uncultured Deefgea sp.]